MRRIMNLNSTLVRFKFIENNENIFNDINPKLISNDLVKKEPLTHVVLSGDKLIRIAEQYNVSVNDIVVLNDIKDSSLITVGQKLLVPRNSKNSISNKGNTVSSNSCNIPSLILNRSID